MRQNELLVIDRTYELVKWFLGRLEKFPRSHRYGLGQRIETRLYANGEVTWGRVKASLRAWNAHAATADSLALRRGRNAGNVHESEEPGNE